MTSTLIILQVPCRPHGRVFGSNTSTSLYILPPKPGMPPRLLHPDEYELVGRDSNESSDTFDLDEADFQSQGLTSISYLKPRRSRIPRIFSRIAPSRLRGIFSARNRNDRRLPKPNQHSLPRFGLHRPSRRLCLSLLCILSGLFILVLLTTLFLPSYTNPPAHYHALKARIKASNDYARANPENQKYSSLQAYTMRTDIYWMVRGVKQFWSL